jgi:hypothetical protein
MPRLPFTMASDLLTSTDGWYRPGGHRLDFFATRDELQELLDLGLPDAFAPWHLTGADSLPRPDQPDRYYQSPWSSPDIDLAAASRTPALRTRTDFFIWSEQLTSGEPPRGTGSLHEVLCSFNGFLLLQLGGQDSLARFSPSSWCIVDRIVHWTTGEERRYPDYLRVYNRLRRLIRKRLIASSVQIFPDGEEWVNAHVKWTAGAAAAHAAGLTFATPNGICRPQQPNPPPD